MRAALLLLTLIFAQSLSFGQAQRRVMVESFTQASCDPCAAQNPGFNQLMFNNWDKVVLLKYQTSWPGTDPMNDQNPTQVRTRVDYYGVTGVPNVHIDGTLDAGTSGSVTQSQVNNAYDDPTPLEMELTHELSRGLDSIYISGVIRNVSDNVFNATNTVLHCAVLEEEILFDSSPGSTNEKDFYNVMRLMIPSDNGAPIDDIAAGDSLVFEYAVPLPKYIYGYDQIAVAAFVQSNGNRRIHQAAYSEAQGIGDEYPDLAISFDLGQADNLCTYTLNPAIVVENAEDTEVTSFEVALFLNGEEVAIQSWTGALSQGQSVSLDMGELPINAGRNELHFEVTNINDGLADYNRFNQLEDTRVFFTLQETPVGESISEAFETTPNLAVPDNTLIIRDAEREFGVVNRNYLVGLGLSVPGQPGAYGGSSKSVMVDFYNWDEVGDKAYLIFEKIDLSESENTILSFDHAHAQYPFSSFDTNDRMSVEVSSDCGDNWVMVYNKAGAALSTRSPVTGYFVPSGSQWTSDTLDLSAFDGAAELTIRFTATSDYGNNLYIDNINVQEVVVSSVDEPGRLEGKVFAYPNPASELVNVDIQLVESSRLDITVFDASGRRISQLAGGEQFPAGAHQLRWEPQHSGLYLIRVASEHGVVSERVSVVK